MSSLQPTEKEHQPESASDAKRRRNSGTAAAPTAHTTSQHSKDQPPGERRTAQARARSSDSAKTRAAAASVQKDGIPTHKPEQTVQQDGGIPGGQEGWGREGKEMILRRFVRSTIMPCA